MHEPDDEHSVVEHARTGDPEAIGWLYDRYFDRIYKYSFLKVGDYTEAEDITEQVFVKMIEAIGNFHWQGSSFASWLFRIAHNQVIDHIRQHSRRPQVPLEPVGQSLPAENSDPHTFAEQSDIAGHIREAMTHLTELQAQVILLKFSLGMSNAEVAVLLGRTEGAIKSLQFSALQNLNKAMTAKGYKP